MLFADCDIVLLEFACMVPMFTDNC